MSTLVLLSLFLAAAPPPAAPPIRLRVGGEFVQAVEGMERVTVKDPSIADVRGLGPDKLWIQALSEGTTSIQVTGRRDRDLTVVVEPVVTARVAGRLELRSGEVGTLRVPGLVRFLVGDGTCLGVERAGEELVLRGRRPCETNVLVTLKDGKQESYPVEVVGNATPSAKHDAVLELAVDRETVLSQPGLASAWSENPKVADVRIVSEAAFVVRGTAPGETVVHFQVGKGVEARKVRVAKGAK